MDNSVRTRSSKSPRRADSRGRSAIRDWVARQTQSVEPKSLTGKQIMEEREAWKQQLLLEQEQELLEEQQKEALAAKELENAAQPKPRRVRSFDKLRSMMNAQEELPSLTFMSGGEISVWKAAASSMRKIDPIDEGDERKKRAGQKVISKARRLTKAMWSHRIKEARATKK